MGCDGGTIPKRCEMVRDKKKKERKDKNMDRKAKWFTCSLSHEKLTQPVVGCRKGFLYNKDAVIEHILGINKNDHARHIKKLKDVKELKLTPNPLYKEQAESLADLDSISPFICPASSLEMNGKQKFGFFWNCGCVVSQRAVKEIHSNSCIICGQSCAATDFVWINPEEEVLENSAQSTTSETISIKKPTGNKVTADNRQPKINNDKKVTKSSLKSTRPISESEKTRLDDNSNTLETKHNFQDSEIYKNLFTSSDSYKKRSKEKEAPWVTTFSYRM